MIIERQKSHPLTARARLLRLQRVRVTIPANVVTGVNDRVEPLRVQKEPALLTVKDSDPRRAFLRIEAFLSHGLPISQATRDAVRAAFVEPAPDPPPPEPNDGLQD